MRSLTDLPRYLLVVMVVGLALMIAACSRKITPVGDGDMTRGDPKAPVTLVEYASVTCSHCADFNQNLMPKIDANYIRTGKVYYVYREFLTPPNEVSAQGILLARCAGKDKYFQVIDAVMASQDEMFSDGDNNALPVLLRIAKQVGLTEPQFKACVTDPKGLQRLQANVNTYATDDHIASTPTFFINGKKLERHTGELAEFDDAIAQASKERTASTEGNK